MKQPRKLWISAGLAALAFAASAQLPAPAPGGGPAPSAQERHSRFDPARMQERIARRQAVLKQKLQITPAQETAWNTFTAAIKPPADYRRPDRAEFARLTTPERIDRMRSLRAARAVEMERRGEATKTFYAVLSSEQKKVFDDLTLRRGHGRHHGHHGRHHG